MIQVRGAREHNLQSIDVDFDSGLTVVTGVSGSGKTSLVFDTLYLEARRRFIEIYATGSSATRLPPAEVDRITGIGPAVAVAQNLLNRNPSSTLATAAGLHPFLRLLFAHFGERRCSRCGSRVVVYTPDEIIEKLQYLAQNGPLPVYATLVRGIPGSHHHLLIHLSAAFGADRLLVDGFPWLGAALDATKPHDIALFLAQINRDLPATELRKLAEQPAALGAAALQIDAAGRMLLLAQTPVCLDCSAWLEDLSPVHFHTSCPHCQGQGCERCQHTGLLPQAAAVRWQDFTFPQLLTYSVDRVQQVFERARPDIPSARLYSEIIARLAALQQVGLGYIGLDRSSPSLSRGEAQRVRLALTLISRLEDMLHVLDEPTIGQHPADLQRLLPTFRQLAGPVVFVEHERAAAAGADQAVDIGPGAGHLGGRVVFHGTPQGLWESDTTTGRYFSLRQRPQLPAARPAPDVFLILRGANRHNLQSLDIAIPLGRLTVITGVSGSGKSTLVEDVLVASLEARKPVGCCALEGGWLKPVMVDQSPIGRNPRSNPATYTKLADVVRDLFAGQSGLSASHFSFNRPEGACRTCEGLGAVEVSMRYLPSTWVTCPECGGQRFLDEVLAARVDFSAGHLSIADFFALPISEVAALFKIEKRLPAARLSAARRILDALVDIGLGYLSLGQPSPSLSGGEAQRVKLAKYLSQKGLDSHMLVLDEPSTGLHPQDLAGLLVVLDRLVRTGATVVVVEHNTDVIRAADWAIDLGPGAGPLGGKLVYAGPPDGLLSTPGSLTGQALRTEELIYPAGAVTPSQKPRLPAISIRGARAHNLKNVAVDIPKEALTVVTGLSGSGKSSLVSDVLETEARRRFLEILSLYERQGIHEGAEAEVDAVSGLGVALTVAPEHLAYSRRSTTGSITDITHHLSALLAACGERTCLACGASMLRGLEQWSCPQCGETAVLARPQHFTSSTYAAACLKCHGVGTMQAPNPKKLIIAPDKPLCDGAMYSPGFFPNGYLGKPFNGGYYLVQALGVRYDFDPLKTTWNEMSPAAQQAFLFGDPEPLTVHYESRTGRRNTHQGRYPGFYGFVGDWDVGGTYTDSMPCPQCGGARLRPEYLAVTLNSLNIHQLNLLTLKDLAAHLAQVALPDETLPPVANSLKTVQQRLRFLIQVGLGYLNLERPAGTLSAGEVQRIRLASLLGSGLTALTILLDEPTRGLHPAEVQALLDALSSLRAEGNTVVVVEHDLQVMEAADYLIDMGPGAGHLGGQVVAQGKPAQVAQQSTLTAVWLRHERQPAIRLPRRTPTGWMMLRGARANNLKGEEVRLPLGVLAGVCGVSGSGKSTLIIDTLGRALVPKKMTTSVAYEPIDPGEYDAIEGAPGRVLLVDQSRRGIGSLAGYLGLMDILCDLYAQGEDAQSLGFTTAQLSAGCSTCGGRGALTLDMAFLPDIHAPCETCRGTGFRPEAWQVHLSGVALPDVFGLTLDEVYELFGAEERLGRKLQTARQVGLGYLALRQPGHTLSGGEVQRLKIADELAHRMPRSTLYILDEPTIGQHLEDVQRLVGVLYRLVDEGGSVIVVEHHTHLLAACDWLLELGPGGGPQGGQIIASGTPEILSRLQTPTAPYLREILKATR